ncbi:NAD(+) diphosphatase [Nocardioides terrisoli]|uniref:NAD(+) diphosphatase n=1 Tax=Nocardioides terrisoli TaxID=3388267 RepID=UPI00287BC8C6|nr:NAD(+) diphosphatase [Nocardioides marmorisolisilvae]
MADQLIPVGAHDRAADRRTDDAWLEQAWADPATRVLAVAGTRLHAPGGEVAWTSSAEAPDGLRAFLGADEHGARFAVVAPRDLADGEDWVGLRAVLGRLPDADASYVVHAVGLAEWHASTRFCPRCAAALQPAQSGHVLHCPSCGRDQFPRTDPAVIMLVTDDDDRALLGRQRVWPRGRWSTLAGFVEPGESLEDAVRREVLEESGIRVGEVTYFGSQPWPFPASLMLGFTARAVSTTIEVDGDELEDARWFSRAEALAGAADGTVVVPAGVSISRRLIVDWYGDELPGSWT